MPILVSKFPHIMSFKSVILELNTFIPSKSVARCDIMPIYTLSNVNINQSNICPHNCKVMEKLCNNNNYYVHIPTLPKPLSGKDFILQGHVSEFRQDSGKDSGLH